jgi:glutathione S-transferase
MTRLFQYHPSGNCYKIRLLLTQLDIPFETVEVDILQHKTRTPEFLAMNANGRVPLVRLDSGEYLPESNAVLWYFAEESAYLPDNRLGRARVLQWMMFEQYSHEPNIATARFWVSYAYKAEAYRDQLEKKIALGYAALDVMEKHLGVHPFFVEDRYTIADIALFAYTHVAHEGGFDLSAYPAVEEWIARIQDQPRHITIAESAGLPASP